MIHSADIREWRNRDVVDPKGQKIGALEAVYVDTTTDEPAMVTVRTGLPTRQRLVFVPVDEAVVGPGYVKVTHPKGLVKKAPSMGVDDILPVEREAEIFQHYDRAYAPGAHHGRRLARR
ncbi:PRC-barrel domain-containing protein [Streptomyces sp. NPDC003631]|uniref:PRC-barrel domain-containing protein n=1 Tax=Streptomyces lannensis TaxID=766498 RepID=A0ABP7JZH7_9ACTN|nr:PRC-barrel domain-containing protein [Streptomyces sp. WAC07094]